MNRTGPAPGSVGGALAGLSNDGDHRRIQTQVFGRSVFSQRYAIDYLLVDAEGRTVPVEGGGNDTYPGYGQEVIAVADGVVSTAVDGVPDNTPGVTPAWRRGAAVRARRLRAGGLLPRRPTGSVRNERAGATAA